MTDRELLIECFERILGDWARIDGEWGPSDGGLEGEISRGEETLIPKIRAHLTAPQQGSKREACYLAGMERAAVICEARAKRHEEESENEDTEDYRERQLVYAKHIRRCIADIHAAIRAEAAKEAK